VKGAVASGALLAAGGVAGRVALSAGPAGEPRAPAGAGERWVPSVCLQCPAGCGILVRVVDDRAVKIEGNRRYPSNQGRLCPKGQSGLQFLYDPDRIKAPMKRIGERGSGQWAPVSWDEALDEVAERLRALRDAGEPHTLVFMSGRNRGQSGDLIDRFLKAFGSPNHVGHSSICEDGSPLGHYLTQGFKAYAGYDWDHTNYLISFGAGFIEAWRPTVRLLRAFGHMRRGRPVRAKIVQVDTRFSVTAAKADEWLAIRPGTDGALALGLAHVILRDGLWDRGFVGDFVSPGLRFMPGQPVPESAFQERMTLGLVPWWNEVVKDFTPERAAEITGIEADTIVRIAREFATTPPAIAAGARGSSMQTNGIYNRAAIHALNALVGSIDAPGGVLVQRDPPLTGWPETPIDSIAGAGLKQPRIDFAGTRRFPLAGKVYQDALAFATGEGPYQAKALFLYYTNPAFSTPDLSRIGEGLRRIPFIVDFSPFLSETAQFADLILPDHTYLERWQDDVIYPSLGYPVVGIRQPVVPPVYDTRNTWDVLLAIARRLGGTMAAAFPWRDAQEILQYRFRGLWQARRGTIVADTFEEFWSRMLEEGVWADPPYTFGEWERVLKTPSGKFEFVSGNLQHKLEQVIEDDVQRGVDPEQALERLLEDLGIEARGAAAFMPHYEPIRHTGDPRSYPLLLNTSKLMTHAEGRGGNVPWLQEIHGVHLGHDGTRWDSWVELNPETARRLGIEHGQLVWVESVVGRVKTRARLNPAAQPDVASMPYEQGHTAYGRWAAGRGANPNWILVNEKDRLGGLAAFFSTRVRVYPGEEA
jgi:anaerobic selenocysteine-containing dehydrogenase